MKTSFRFVTGRLLLMAALLIGIGTRAYAWDYSASGQWASFNFGDWTVYQNEWGSSAYCELYANSYSNFASAGDWTGGGTKNYAHVQSKVLNIPIDDYWMTSSFNFSPPSGAIYNFMYDVWTENMQDELIIIERATTSGNWGNQIASNATIGGRYYSSVWQAWNGANNVIIFSPGSMRTSGTEDLMAHFKWCKDRGLLHNNVVREISFGVEVTSTNGWQQFTVNSFSASWGRNGNGNSGNVSIQNRATGLFLDGMGRTSNGSDAGQWGGSSSSNQKWTMESSGSNVRFKNVATGLYLDGMGRSSNGSLVGQWSNSGSSNQQWTVETYGNYKRIRNVATGLYIDGMYWNSNGSNLGQWGGSGSDAQQWAIQ